MRLGRPVAVARAYEDPQPRPVAHAAAVTAPVLLVAPLVVTGDAPPATALPAVPDAPVTNRLVTRSAYETTELTHAVRGLPAGPGAVEAWLVGVREEQFLIVLTDPIDVQFERADVEQVEKATLDLVTAYCTPANGIAAQQPRWVSRTLLLPAGAEVPDIWLQARPVLRHVDLDQDRRAELLLSWGNNAVTGWDLVERAGDQGLALRDEVVRGLVDAQYMWVRMLRHAEATTHIAHEITADGTRPTRRAYLRYQRELGLLQNEIVRADLCRQELEAVIQGARRHVALGALESWEYDQALDRGIRRADNLERLLEQRREALDVRYKSASEKILFALALTSLVGLGLSLVQLAYSGAVDTIPGDGSGLHILDYLRARNADVILLWSIAPSLAILVVTLFLRRRK